jgi:Flp pilus assembly protein CpaB
MNSRRLIIVILLAVGLVIIFGAIGYVFFTGGVTNPFAEAPTATPPPPTITVEAGQPTPVATTAPDTNLVEVVVSLQTVPRGFRMTENELTTEFRVAEQVPLNVYTSIEDVIGLYARQDIYQGETLTQDALVDDLTAVGQTSYGPSSLIPPGFVAMAVPMDRLSSVGYALNSGDSVDILISFFLSPIDEQFQTRLPNNATFYLEQPDPPPGEEGSATVDQSVIGTESNLPEPYTLDPYGRFEQLPNGDTVHVSPSEEEPRKIHVAFLIQNAKVIQVGHWYPPNPAAAPTPTPPPAETGAEGEAPAGDVTPTPTSPAAGSVIAVGPPYNNTLVLALPPQQQIFLKYALETESIVDFALRGINDGELYAVENVTLDYILNRFGVEIPPNFTYVVNTQTGLFEGFKPNDDLQVTPVSTQVEN